MEWVQTLKWPAQIETDKPPPGISWVELAIDFLFLAQPTILTSVKEDGSTRYKNNEEHVGFDVKAHGFTKTVNSFRDSLEHLQYLLQIPIVPTLHPAKVKSICLLGSGHF